jgi:hypothetical protein
MGFGQIGIGAEIELRRTSLDAAQDQLLDGTSERLS